MIKRIFKSDRFWVVVIWVIFASPFGFFAWSMLTYSDKRTSAEIQEDRLFQECFNAARRAQADSYQTIGGQTFNKAIESKMEQFDATYDQSREECYTKYHRGYKRIIKYQEERP